MIRFHDETFCPGCGRAGVVVALDSTLLEVRPEIRRHVCGLGGPGSSAPEPVECCASGRCEVCTPGYDWGRDG